MAATEAPFFLELPVPPQQMDPPQPTVPQPPTAAATGTNGSNGNGNGNGNGKHADVAAAVEALEAQIGAAAGGAADAVAAAAVQPPPLPQRSKYGEDVVFIANDWHAALVPVYLAGKYRPHGVYRDARCLLAIHNLRHQVG